MDLKEISSSELLNRMQKLVRTERKITHLILMLILEIESRRIYAELGYDGMYTYLTRGLGYSEAAAYRRLQAARLLRVVPQVAEKIESGALNLTQLAQVQKCVKESAPKPLRADSPPSSSQMAQPTVLDILEKLERKNSFETKKILAQEFDHSVRIHEVIKPQKDGSVRLEVTLSAEQYEQLVKAKDMLSHICPEGSWAEVISVLAFKFNKKLHANAPSAMTPSVPATKGGVSLKSAKNRSYISIYKRRYLLQKANACCEYIDSKTGNRCASKYQLQIDHRHPKSKGGSESIENLRILCRTHNLLMADKWGLSRYSKQ